MHVNTASHDSHLYESAVRTWILDSDDRFSGEIEWTPVLPGDWKQHQLIKSIFAACESQATARARGLARPARGGSRPRQASQGGRTLPPQHVPHNLADKSAAGWSAIGSSTEAVASGNADAAPRKTCSRVHERRSCDSTRSATPASGAAAAAAAPAAVASNGPAGNGPAVYNAADADAAAYAVNSPAAVNGPACELCLA